MKTSNIFPRHTSYDLPYAVRGDGCYIIDKNDKRYLDASGGAAVSCLGHSDITVRNAIIEQTEKLAFAHTSFFTSDPAEKLANLLAENSPKGLNKVYFVSSGSEAVEASLKLARQYFIEIGEPEVSTLYPNLIFAQGVVPDEAPNKDFVAEENQSEDKLEDDSDEEGLDNYNDADFY